jgi:phosphonopyruvate decarboxylase
VALAAGSFEATQKPAVVYMQNSGLGNAINPLLSLADPELYAIPMLLLVGWRGEPGTSDEPQHKTQGLVTEALLAACQIPFQILPTEMDLAEQTLDWVASETQKRHGPVALLERKGTFDTVPYPSCTEAEFKREDAIETILDGAPRAFFVASTGFISRELWSLREKRGESHENDFLVVGSMGHASSVALGMALQKPGQQIVCLDGDGAMLMHMGAMATLGQSGAENLVHIVLNNGAHASVGGQPTVAWAIDAVGVARACGYGYCARCWSRNELRETLLNSLQANNGPAFLEAVVSGKARKDLGRPVWKRRLQNG